MKWQLQSRSCLWTGCRKVYFCGKLHSRILESNAKHELVHGHSKKPRTYTGGEKTEGPITTKPNCGTENTKHTAWNAEGDSQTLSLSKCTPIHCPVIPSTNINCSCTKQSNNGCPMEAISQQWCWNLGEEFQLVEVSLLWWSGSGKFDFFIIIWTLSILHLASHLMSLHHQHW